MLPGCERKSTFHRLSSSRRGSLASVRNSRRTISWQRRVGSPRASDEAAASGDTVSSREGVQGRPWQLGEQGARPRGGEPEVPGAERCEHERERRSVMSPALLGRWRSSLRGRRRQALSDHRGRTASTRRRGATRGVGEARWRRRMTNLRGRGTQRPTKAGEGPCRAWSAKSLDVHPSETTDWGIDGGFERPLVKPLQ